MFKLITNSYSVIEFILLNYLSESIKNFKIKVDDNNEFVAHANRLVEFSSQDKIEVTIKF